MLSLNEPEEERSEEEGVGESVFLPVMVVAAFGLSTSNNSTLPVRIILENGEERRREGRRGWDVGGEERGEWRGQENGKRESKERGENDRQK